MFSDIKFPQDVAHRKLVYFLPSYSKNENMDFLSHSIGVTVKLLGMCSVVFPSMYISLITMTMSNRQQPNLVEYVRGKIFYRIHCTLHPREMVLRRDMVTASGGFRGAGGRAGCAMALLSPTLQNSPSCLE